MAGLMDFFGGGDSGGLMGGSMGAGGMGGGNDEAFRRALLTVGLGLMSNRTNSLSESIGRAGLQGVQAYGDTQQMQRQNKMQDFQFGQMMDEAKRKKQMQDLPGQFMRQPTMPPTMDNRDAGQPGETPMAASLDMEGYSNALMGLDPQQGLQLQAMLRKQAPALMNVAPGGSVFDPSKGEAVYKAPFKPAEPEKTPEALRVLEMIHGKGSPQYMQAAQQYAQKLTTHTPGTSLTVNTGQKGLDNELKIRGDFRSEPVYKAHQEMQAAHAQIQQSLKQASPAGDLAGATKIMKLLDPGSVVRESELGMAMAATGLMDRAQNYAQNIISGNKLTPKQRVEFQQLADALYGESVKSFNAKRGEYDQLGAGYGMNTGRLLGPAASAPRSPIANSAVDDLVNKYRSK